MIEEALTGTGWEVLPWVGGQREGCRERTRGRRRGPPGPRTARRAPRRGSTRGSEGRTARSTAGAGRWRFGSRGLVAAADGGSRGAVSGPGRGAGRSRPNGLRLPRLGSVRLELDPTWSAHPSSVR